MRGLNSPAGFSDQICTVSPGEFNPGAGKRDYNTETKTVQIVATSAEHAVFFDRRRTNASQKNSAKVTGAFFTTEFP